MIAPSGALLTDFYQLTMLEAYFRQGMNKVAAFDIFVRRYHYVDETLLPSARGGDAIEDIDRVETTVGVIVL